ncbi:glycosyltransferase [Microbacterium lushaniae]|uniref:Glycosyl transferase family 2 n=1 Tax=Microbacterium lushaniae TaxID=2614639 RepID=A0A5J6L7E0_9MICO|nr:glycosyltransferase [Microbacterium lushaniae]QEW04242.1 hypothetical protein F6J85_14865 [Microbacterium lushaniae]
MADTSDIRTPSPARSASTDWVTWRDLDATETAAVSVIVPAGECDVDLEVRLPAVLNQTVSPHEIVVIDSSPDGRHFGAVTRLEQAGTRTAIRYVRSPALSPGALRRLAARLAAGNVRAFAFAGSLLPATWVERIGAAVRGMRSPAFSIA